MTILSSVAVMTIFFSCMYVSLKISNKIFYTLLLNVEMVSSKLDLVNNAEKINKIGYMNSDFWKVRLGLNL